MAKILLVDDNQDVLFVAKGALMSEGHEITVALDGEECLEILQNKTFDLILLDVMMPGINGWDVCKKIKSDPKTRDIPVAMFTVKNTEEDLVRSIEYAHSDAHINKPYHNTELLSAVERLLKK